MYHPRLVLMLVLRLVCAAGKETRIDIGIDAIVELILNRCGEGGKI